MRVFLLPSREDEKEIEPVAEDDDDESTAPNGIFHEKKTQGADETDTHRVFSDMLLADETNGSGLRLVEIGKNRVRMIFLPVLLGLPLLKMLGIKVSKRRPAP